LTQAALDEAQSALDRGDVHWAAHIALEAIAEGVEHPVLLNLAAWSCDQAGDLEAAARFLGRAMTLDPDNLAAVAAFARNMARQGRLRRALTEFDRTVAMAPDEPLLWFDRGDALDEAGALVKARAAFRRAVRLDAGLAAGWARLAAIAAKLGDGAEARRLAVDALALDPADPVAEQSLAAADLLEGDVEAAMLRLAALLRRSGLDPALERRTAALLGEARDGLGDRPGAWSAWRDAKATLAPAVSPAAPRAVDQVQRLAQQLAAMTPGDWPHLPPLPEGERSPAFLIGPARSGLALLANALAGLPGVAIVEGQPTLAAADALVRSHGGLAWLATLGDRDALWSRSAYWSMVYEAGCDSEGRQLIDADAGKALKLPLIARLFPGARIVLLRRDPRDVVLSQFAHPFPPSPEAAETADIVTAAAQFAVTAGFVENAASRLPLETLLVRYEELVRDFDGQTRRVAAFLGLDWTPAVHDFAGTAARRGTPAASAFQRGLINRSGRWRPYATQLAPVLPMLRPWIEHWGYPWQET
jgi:tetratricopeptide (TPR) repeat protein